MRAPEDRTGMETPVSMMLLVVASLVAASVLVHHIPAEKGEDLYGIRLVQARSVAQAIHSFRDPSGYSIKDAIMDLPLHIISDGDGGFILPGPDNGICGSVRSLISATPDDMMLSVFICEGDRIAPHLKGERAAFTTDLEEGVHLIVTISLHRGSMSYGGDPY